MTLAGRTHRPFGRAMRHAGGPLTCREVVELSSDYLDGALHAATIARVAAHTGGCGGCATYLAQIQATVATLDGLAVDAVAVDALRPEAAAGLLDAFRAWARGR